MIGELSPALLETLFAEAPFGLALLDPDLRFVRVNEELADAIGRKVEDHPGLRLNDLGENPLERLKLVMATGKSLIYEATSGSTTWLVSSFPVREDGRLVGVGAMLVDVSGQKESERRASFLADAGALLDSSLDLEQTLRTLTRIVVPTLADWCTVDLLEGDRIAQVAVAHPDPAREALAWELYHRWPPRLDSAAGIGTVIRTGETEYRPSLDGEGLDLASGGDPDRRRMLERLDLRSTVAVPLRARGRVVGALGFATAESGRRFSPADVALFEDLARRASLAVDNARLFTELRAADRTKTFLAEAARLLAASLDFQTTIDTVARLVTSHIADACVVSIVEKDTVRAPALAHVSERKRELLERLYRDHTPLPDDEHTGLGASSGAGRLYAEVGEDFYRSAARSPEHLELLREIGTDSAIIVPLVARGRTLGSLAFLNTESGRHFGSDDLALAEELASRTAVAADNAILFADRTRVARTLQSGLLPSRVPDIPGLEVAARFRPAGDGTEVGGDFYDVYPVDGSFAAVVGDVCGKGAVAASLTALARYTLRTAARYEDAPSRGLLRLHEEVAAYGGGIDFCTAAHVRIQPREGGVRLVLALGGHPPPALVRAGGTVELLDLEGALLGVFEPPAIEDRELWLAPGDALVLYTDGVTEAGAPANAFGEERLAELLRRHAGSSAEELAGTLERTVLQVDGGRPRDDVAVLVLWATG